MNTKDFALMIWRNPTLLIDIILEEKDLSKFPFATCHPGNVDGIHYHTKPEGYEFQVKENTKLSNAIIILHLNICEVANLVIYDESGKSFNIKDKNGLFIPSENSGDDFSEIAEKLKLNEKVAAIRSTLEAIAKFLPIIYGECAKTTQFPKYRNGQVFSLRTSFREEILTAYFF